MLRILSVFLFAVVTIRSMASEYGSYSTEGHTKAQGVSVILDYPLEWKPSENPKPGIIHEFRDPTTGGRDAMIIVMPTVQPKKPTPKNFRESLQHPEAQERIMPGARHLKKEFIEKLDYPCVALDYDLLIPQVAPAVVQVRNYILLVKGKMLQIQFYAVAPTTADIRAERADMMMHVIRSIKPAEH